MTDLNLRASDQMGLWDHVGELRSRVLVSFGFFIFAVLVFFSQGYVLLALLEVPARGVIREFIFTAPTEAFTTYFKVVLLASFIVSFPVMLYQFWAFVAPAMPRKSRLTVSIWFLFALASFIGGIAFAYSVLLPSAFSFLVAFGQGIATPMISLSEYISFAVAIIFMGGIVFEIPCVMGILTEVGILNTRILCSSRRYAILIIFILAAIITPTQDPFNMIIFVIPMVLLFEFGVMICRVIENRKSHTLQEKV